MEKRGSSVLLIPDCSPKFGRSVCTTGIVLHCLAVVRWYLCALELKPQGDAARRVAPVQSGVVGGGSGICFVFILLIFAIEVEEPFFYRALVHHANFQCNLGRG